MVISPSLQQTLIAVTFIYMQYKEQILHNNLKRIRKSLGLKQQDVANLLGLSVVDRISHWELGKAVPSIVNLFRLSNIYNVLPHELYPDLQKKMSEEIIEKRSKI
jgi:transcriptional regulator with XRE-family HTH domain